MTVPGGRSWEPWNPAEVVPDSRPAARPGARGIKAIMPPRSRGGTRGAYRCGVPPRVRLRTRAGDAGERPEIPLGAHPLTGEQQRPTAISASEFHGSGEHAVYGGTVGRRAVTPRLIAGAEPGDVQVADPQLACPDSHRGQPRDAPCGVTLRQAPSLTQASARPASGWCSWNASGRHVDGSGAELPVQARRTSRVGTRHETQRQGRRAEPAQPPRGGTAGRLSCRSGFRPEVMRADAREQSSKAR
jgi:hypothetical protein